MPRAICGGGSSLGIAASDICPILPFFQSSNADQKLEILTLRPAKGAKVGGFRPAAAGAKASQGPFTCGTGELRSSRRVVSRRVCRALFLSVPAVARDQKISQGFDRLAASSVPLVAAAPRMNMHLACHGPFAAAEAASGSPPAAFAVSWDDPSCQAAQ